MRTLEFTNKSEILTLDELKETLIAEDAGGKLSKALQSMIADTPLIKNLENQNYRTKLDLISTNCSSLCREKSRKLC